jgi:hypothetical protein
VQTDKTIPDSKPDIIICDNGKGTWILTDVIFAGDRKVIKREGKMILQYKDPTLHKNSLCKM